MICKKITTEKWISTEQQDISSRKLSRGRKPYKLSSVYIPPTCTMSYNALS
jgi:hypothetical protein